MEGPLAVLSDLVQTISNATGLLPATVFAHGRFAREEGWISQKGRGRSAAQMTVRDAANLFVAVAASDVVKEAALTIRDYRELKGYCWLQRAKDGEPFLEWLRPLGLRRNKELYSLKASLGTFIEYCIQTAGSGSLHRMLARIPTYELSPALRKKWVSENSDYFYKDVDELVRLGLVTPGFNKNVAIKFTFARNARMVEVELIREWEGLDTVAVIRFERPGEKWLGDNSSFRLQAVFSEQCLTGLGLSLRGIEWPVDAWPGDFFKYFGCPERSAIEHVLEELPGSSEVKL